MNTLEHVIAIIKFTSRSINGGRNYKFVLYDKESLFVLAWGKYRTVCSNPKEEYEFALLKAGYEAKRITVIDADEAVIPF